MKYYWIFAGYAVIAGCVIFLHTSLPHIDPVQYKTTTITMGGESFNTQIADTDPLREQGLSYRKTLGTNEAMLFVFEQSGMYPFWMKDMNFPIDIIWLDSSKHIIYVEKNLSPTTYPKAFGPTLASQYVIEVVSGTLDRFGLHMGDPVVF